MEESGLTDGQGNPVATSAGFLQDYLAWDRLVAVQIASRAGIELTQAHWEIILFIREYYSTYRHLPNNRMFVKAIRTRFGEDKGNTRYLYTLFPEAPLKFACMIGGLPRPASCI